MHTTERTSVDGEGFLSRRSTVLDLRQVTSRTAIEMSGINFSTNEKNAGGFLFEKIKKGSARSNSISAPIIIVAIMASIVVSFILASLEET